tara:strand:- start:28 stop:330 length:303 start_codon:yes stop_codon:yes gene_type:complete
MSNSDKVDSYGFDNNFKYNRSSDYKSKKPFLSTKYFIIIIVVSILALLFLSSSFIAGYYSWNEFPNDSYITKSIKTYIAVLFSPFYLAYVFLKLSLFRTS